MGTQTISYGYETVLVVDDEEAVAESVAALLRHLGFHVFEALSSREALDILREKRITFLLTDIKMPGMNGFELIEHVKKEFPSVCIIAMTGYLREYSYVDVVNAGATDFINKPFGIEELEAKIRRAIMERELRNELNHLCITDSLTGLYNRRHFFIRLQEEILRAERQQHPLGVLLIDLDGFKAYNDSFGHLAGDALLWSFAGMLNRNIRVGVDAAFRYGGDEFVLLLPDTDTEVLVKIAGRIEEAAGKECHIQASVGAANHVQGMTPEDLVDEADKDLYRKKGAKGGKTGSKEKGPARGEIRDTTGPVGTRWDGRCVG